MKKKIDLNERMAASGACGCGHAADDHGHEPDSHAGHDCCGGTADHAPEHQHAENCCRGSRIAASTQDRDGLPVTAEGEGTMSDHAHHLPNTQEHLGHRQKDPQQTSFWKSKTGLVTIVFLVIGAFFLVTEHRAHLLGWLPWLILPACLFLHLFMHGGHSGHGGHGGHSDAKPPQRPDDTIGTGD